MWLSSDGLCALRSVWDGTCVHLVFSVYSKQPRNKRVLQDDQRCVYRSSGNRAGAGLYSTCQPAWTRQPGTHMDGSKWQVHLKTASHVLGKPIHNHTCGRLHDSDILARDSCRLSGHELVTSAVACSECCRPCGTAKTVCKPFNAQWASYTQS